jgi:hypothetical protein
MFSEKHDQTAKDAYSTINLGANSVQFNLQNCKDLKSSKTKSTGTIPIQYLLGTQPPMDLNAKQLKRLLGSTTEINGVFVLLS